MVRIVFIILSLIFVPDLNAQPGYAPITHLTGVVNIYGNNVTVTPTSSGTGSNSVCGISPYWLGTYQNTPGSYRFDFSIPVGSIKVKLSAINDGEIISFKINGNNYLLLPSNFAPYPGNCNQPEAVVVNGNLEFLITDKSGGGEVTINGDISSVEVHANGLRNGTIFSIAFKSLFIETNTPCTGDTLKIFAHPFIRDARYQWNGPSGFVSSSRHLIIPGVTRDAEGTYHLTVTTPNDTFSDSVYVTVRPTPFTQIQFNQPLCEGGTLYLSDTCTLPGTEYSWTGAAGFLSSEPRPYIQNIKTQHAGTYRLVTLLNGCSFETEAEINIYQHVHIALTEYICTNETYYFKGTWLKEPGIYYDTLQQTNGCDSTITLDLLVKKTPVIEVDITEPAFLCFGDSIAGSVNGADHYSWYHNGRLIGTNNEQVILLNNLFNYIEVVGMLDNGCMDTFSVTQTSEPCCDIFIPNAFSPNGDGLNDHFQTLSQGNFLTFQLQIFNRWGQLLFSSLNKDISWDGSYIGRPAAVGTYFYHIKAKCLDGTQLIRKGEVHLIR